MVATVFGYFESSTLVHEVGPFHTLSLKQIVLLETLNASLSLVGILLQTVLDTVLFLALPIQHVKPIFTHPTFIDGLVLEAISLAHSILLHASVFPKKVPTFAHLASPVFLC